MAPEFTAAHSGAVSRARASVADALWLAGGLVVALLAIYFVGFDQGATSIFGEDSHIHEFVHDGRHLLGFPCH